MSKVRKNFIKERNNKKLTQVVLAEKLLISERQLQHIEAGTSRGSVSFWERAKEFFDLPIDYLLFQNNEIKLHEDYTTKSNSS